MSAPASTLVPAARTAMLIRRPLHEVFEAWADPAVTSRFWFTRGSDRLEAGRRVEWEWAMYGFTIPIHVKVVERDARIVVDWPGDPAPTTVEWRFHAFDESSTFVEIENAGFQGDPDAVVRQVNDASSGFSMVLVACKTLLEHGLELHVVRDRHPYGLGKGPASG